MSSVAVITPYCVEPLELLERNQASVRSQTRPCRHVLVAYGFARGGVNGWAVDHVILPRSHSDIGSTPRLIGCYHAIGLGCDAVAFLDADNWYHSDHIRVLMDLRREEVVHGVVESALLPKDRLAWPGLLSGLVSRPEPVRQGLIDEPASDLVCHGREAVFVASRAGAVEGGSLVGTCDPGSGATGRRSWKRSSGGLPSLSARN